MKAFLRTREGAELIAETIISVIFGIIIAILGWEKILTGKELLVALVIWALITPSPSRWVITIGDFVRAQKNGQNGSGGNIPPTGGNPQGEPVNSSQG